VPRSSGEAGNGAEEARRMRKRASQANFGWFLVIKYVRTVIGFKNRLCGCEHLLQYACRFSDRSRNMLSMSGSRLTVSTMLHINRFICGMRSSRSWDEIGVVSKDLRSR
jgi:hypothetical protein